MTLTNQFLFEWMNIKVGVSVRNNVIDDDEQQHNAVPTTESNNTSNAVVSSVTLAGPSGNATENNSTTSRFLLHANFPSLFDSNNRHDGSTSGNGDASNESATPGRFRL